MGISSSYLHDMNSTSHSISSDDKGDRRWASFEFYPYKRGIKRVVYKGISFKSRVELKPQDENQNETLNEKDNKGTTLKTIETISNTYWTKRKCVVKSATNDDIDWNNKRNEKSHWFKELSISGSEYADMFRKEVTSVNKNSTIIFVKSYLAAIDNMSSLWNNICYFFKRGKKRMWCDDFVLLEERIYGNFKHFIFVDGSVDDECPEMLKAFVHFSFHKSEGKIVICDLQGALNNNNYYLTCPTIHSVHKSFGPKDQGDTGIKQVFSNHECNDFCQKDWIKP